VEQLVEQVELYDDYGSPCCSGACSAVQQLNESTGFTDIYLEGFSYFYLVSSAGSNGYRLYAESDT
jgi:hypothetical protein